MRRKRRSQADIHEGKRAYQFFDFLIAEMSAEIITHQAETALSDQTRLVFSLFKTQRSDRTAAEVELVETHISWVLLAGQFAYKIKKAIHLEFLDFTALERRQFFCGEEIRLNRRLAPQIYLDVVPIGGSGEAPEFGRTPALEYAVRMNRFDTADEMDRRLRNGTLLARHVDSLAQTLAHFHHGLHSIAPDMSYGDAHSVFSSAMQNLEQLRQLLPEAREQDALASLERVVEAEYLAREKCFRQRRRDGYVRECHGDLHLANIVVIGDEAVPFDGIEFDPVLRWIDVIGDLAFPFMDLTYFGKPNLANRLLNRYLEETGDYGGMDVLHFHASGRAAVRAKVHAIRAAQQSAGERERREALAASRAYLDLAAQFLLRPHPVLIITSGLPGSGKSTFAQAASEMLGAIRIRSDVERKRLFGLAPMEGSPERVDSYAAEATARTYDALHDIARKLLAAGVSVIVDAAFLKQAERDRFCRLADATGVPFAMASLRAGEAQMQKRITERMRQGNDPSEADLEVLAVLQQAQEPLLSHERIRSVEFVNDGEHGFVVDDRSWNALKAMLSCARPGKGQSEPD